MTVKQPDASAPGLQAGGGASESQRAIKSLNDTAALPHLRKIFTAHAGNDQGKWSKDQVAGFLRSVQGCAEAAELAAQPDHLAIASGDGIDLQGFLDYMTSPAAALSAPPKEQDLSWPLHSYFISSSHNTYLTGNQLSSDSSTDAYKNVLLRGCRCIEVDVWNGDDSDVSDASSESGDESDRDGKKTRRSGEKESKLKKLRDKLPGSLSGRLSRKKSVKSKTDDATPASTAAASSKEPTPGQGHPEKMPSPQAALVEPRVFHGYTLTTEISFRDVCEVVRDYAFVATDTPLVVSLEVHCSPEQQELMVQIMEQTWKGLLVAIPDQDPDALPPPGSLKGKILVKVKYAPPTTASPDDDTLEDDDSPPPDGRQTKPSKISHALSRLGIYTRGVSFKSFDQPEASMPTHIFSLAEKKVIETHEKEAQALFDHNRNYMMRAYPSGFRIRSSNLDPAPFWRKGIQVVALNWQRWDEGMMLNEGMFAGTHGYVLKPEGYRGEKQGLAPSSSPLHIPRRTLDLHVEVLAGQNIPLPPGDDDPKGFKPYVKVELHVEGPDEKITDDGAEKEGEYKAKTKSMRGCNPDFGGEVLRFPSITGVVEELAFVRFTIRDDEFGRDDLAAWACVRLDRLRNGYRFVHLLDCEGQITEASVLVKVSKAIH